MKKTVIAVGLLLLSIVTVAMAGELKLPWTATAVQGAIKTGNKIVYAMSGSGEYWAEHKCNFYIEVQKIKGETITFITYKLCPGEEEPSSTGDHEINFLKNGLSPFFRFRKAEINIKGPEKITVPAGTFQCTVVELKSSFWGVEKVWMIDNMPGIYAKVIKKKAVYSLKTLPK